MKLEITDDTPFGISCYITDEGKRCFYKSGKRTVLYDFDSAKTMGIRIFKEDIWASGQGLSTFMLIVYIFDWISGFDRSLSVAGVVERRPSRKGILVRCCAG